MWIDDEVLRRASEPMAIECWVPGEPMVVLGSSNKVGQEVKEKECEADGVAILKRYGGGGTVLLHSGCVVVSVGTWVREPFANDRYFRLLNQSMIDALSGAWPKCANFRQRGFSDIVLGEKKLAGTSLFRSRNYLLYQASLLVDPDIQLIERYLHHPSREPDYRAGRDHRSFLMGLADVVPGVSAHETMTVLRDQVGPALAQQLEGEFVLPVAKQIPYLLARAGSL